MNPSFIFIVDYPTFPDVGSDPGDWDEKTSVDKSGEKLYLNVNLIDSFEEIPYGQYWEYGRENADWMMDYEWYKIKTTDGRIFHVMIQDIKHYDSFYKFLKEKT